MCELQSLEAQALWSSNYKNKNELGNGLKYGYI